MPKIRIKHSTYERLEDFANKFETEDMAINRILDEVEILDEALSKLRELEETNDVSSNIQMIDPGSVSDWDLKHTKILDAKLAEQLISNPTWTELLRQILILAVDEIGSINELKSRFMVRGEALLVDLVDGWHLGYGYVYVPEIDCSFRYPEANRACKTLVAITLELNVKLNILLMKKRKEKAIYPGEKARLIVRESIDLPW